MFDSRPYITHILLVPMFALHTRCSALQYSNISNTLKARCLRVRNNNNYSIVYQLPIEVSNLFAPLITYSGISMGAYYHNG